MKLILGWWRRGLRLKLEKDSNGGGGVVGFGEEGGEGIGGGVEREVQLIF